jgi:GNAT superfamily N-acetyltransferase
MEIQQCKLARDILKCKEVLLELRPHLLQTDLVTMITEMMLEGYQLAFIEEDGKAVAAIGYRYVQYLYNGKHFYIDDLSTLPAYRGNGYAGALLDFVEAKARENGYLAVTLDSGHQRTAAHRLYLNKGFIIAAHHFTKNLK